VTNKGLPGTMKSALKSENWLMGRILIDIRLVNRRDVRGSSCSGVASVSRTSGIGASGVHDLSVSLRTVVDCARMSFSVWPFDIRSMPTHFWPCALRSGVVMAWYTYSREDGAVSSVTGFHGEGVPVQLVKFSSEGQGVGSNPTVGD